MHRELCRIRNGNIPAFGCSGCSESFDYFGNIKCCRISNVRAGACEQSISTLLASSPRLAFKAYLIPRRTAVVKIGCSQLPQDVQVVQGLSLTVNVLSGMHDPPEPRMCAKQGTTGSFSMFLVAQDILGQIKVQISKY